MTPSVAFAAIEAALSLPIRPPDEAGSHLTDERRRDLAVRHARAAYYVACEKADAARVGR